MSSAIRWTQAGSPRRWGAGVLAVGTTTAMVIFGVVAGTQAASAQSPSSVGLGTATPFAVLAGTTVTNTGPSIISGDLGVSPGTAVTGFPPGLVTNGTAHAADAVAAQAQADLTTGYDDAAGRTPATTVSSDLGGQTLAPGVYKAASALGLTGTLTLDAQNNPDAVFIFQSGSTLITASNSTVNLINGADPCHVFWQVGSSATLGTRTTFAGSILALTSATVQTGTTVAGRILARNGQVSLNSNTITSPDCDTPTTTTTPPTTTTGPTTPPTTTTPPATGPGGGPGGPGSGVAGSDDGDDQVKKKPEGGVDTGDGSTSGGGGGGYLLGGLVLTAAGGAALAARRHRRQGT